MNDQFIVDKMGPEKKPFLTVVFKQDPDMAIAFTGKKEEGISLYYLRQSENICTRVKSEIITTVFKPHLSEKNRPNQYCLELQPLIQPLTVDLNKSVCRYPFKEQGKMVKVDKVVVDACQHPKLKIQNTVYGSFRARQDSPVQHLELTETSSDEFADNLYNYFLR